VKICNYSIPAYAREEENAFIGNRSALWGRLSSLPLDHVPVRQARKPLPQ